MSRGAIDFYFDIISPFSYIAYEALLQFGDQLDVKINFKPASIAQIFKSAGTSAPALCPAKARYNYYDIPLVAKFWNVPFKHVTLKDFVNRVLKGNTGKSQLFLTAVSLHQPNDLRKLMRRFWRHLYCNDNNIFSEEDIREVCRINNISNVEKLIELSKSEEVKQLYEQTTKEALESGAFGVPWMVVKLNGQKPFKLFGTDRLHILFYKMGIPFNGALPLAKL